MKTNKGKEKTEIYGESSLVRTTIYKITGAKTKKFELVYQKYNDAYNVGNKIVLARFDTEEKARMYLDAFNEGIDVGKNL